MDESLSRDVVYFARTNFRNADRLFGAKRKDRRQHMYVVGKSGTGKTTLLKNMMIQDIANGEGVCVVDPHGEFVEELLSKIPEERINDVVYFNPADPDYSVGFNILEIPDPRYKHLVASGLMGIFTKIWSGVWSARMEYIMNNSVLALLDTPGSTLLGILRLLVDKEYRQMIVSNIKDPVVKGFWVNEFEEWKEQFRTEAIAPIQNKVGQFLSNAMVRNIVGQAKSTIDVLDIINTGKIFLVNVSKGRIGEDNSSLLGAMIITKLQLAAMERVRIPEDERVDFFLYVDEFQNFATDSFANILSEARKYRLNIILAHQYIGQLVTDASTKVRDAVFGNVGTMVLFRVGAADAEFLEKEFEPEFEIQDMVNLPNRMIFLKLMVDGVMSRPFSAGTLPPFNFKTSEDTDERVIESSRGLYTRPRYLVEEDISQWTGMGEGRMRRAGADRGFVRERTQDYSTLANLGIEFEATSQVSRPRPAFSPSSAHREDPRGREFAKPQDRGPWTPVGPRPISAHSTEPSNPPVHSSFQVPARFPAPERPREPAPPIRKHSIMQRSLPNVKSEGTSGPGELRLTDLKPEEQRKKTVVPEVVSDLSDLRSALRDALGKIEKEN